MYASNKAKEFANKSQQICYTFNYAPEGSILPHMPQSCWVFLKKQHIFTDAVKTKTTYSYVNIFQEIIVQMEDFLWPQSTDPNACVK